MNGNATNTLERIDSVLSQSSSLRASPYSTGQAFRAIEELCKLKEGVITDTADLIDTVNKLSKVL